MWFAHTNLNAAGLLEQVSGFSHEDHITIIIIIIIHSSGERTPRSKCLHKDYVETRFVLLRALRT